MSQTEWTGGYAADRDYTAGFYPEQSPEHLNLACVLNGVEPIPLDRPFTYFELGCGYGLTAILLAASHPKGRFFAADFMPSHIATGQQLADAAQLDNLSLLESSFAQLADGEVELPPLDFITLHGVYTWVSAERREEIVRFIARYLKPGGIVYVSYNALPGWAPALPLQRLMLSQAALQGGHSGERVLKARDFVEQLVAAGAGYFQNQLSLSHELESLRKGDPAYLVHEYLHSGWSPLYHADVAAGLSGAKLEYVGPATLSEAMHRLPEEQQRLLDGVADGAWRETLKDFLLNTRFRKDVFVRGRRALPPGRRQQLLQKASLSLTMPRAAASFGFERDKLPGDPEDAVLDVLAQTPLQLEQLLHVPAFSGQFELIVQIAAMMTDTRHGGLTLEARGAVDAAAARRLNRAIALQSRQGPTCPGFASPVVGNGIKASLLERLVYAEICEGESNACADRLAALLQPRLDELAATGQTASAHEPKALSVAIEAILTGSLPMWKRLGVL